jgi:hypothetical protein
MLVSVRLSAGELVFVSVVEVSFAIEQFSKAELHCRGLVFELAQHIKDRGLVEARGCLVRHRWVFI